LEAVQLLRAFGAAGALIVLLLWVYYSAQIFLLGAEFTKVYANRHGSNDASSSRCWAVRRHGPSQRKATTPERCRLHGGKSTGPRTPEGLERSRRSNWKHGYYSREAKAERSRVRAAILALRDLRMLCD
jgi:Virulence factor BrkB